MTNPAPMTTNELPTLLPCPFCGGRAEATQWGEDYLQVRCAGERGEYKCNYYWIPIHRWNTRADSTLSADCAAMQEALEFIEQRRAIHESPAQTVERIFSHYEQRATAAEAHCAAMRKHADIITEYLSVGGLFNPELMEHEKVRDLLIAIRETILSTTAGTELLAERDALKEKLHARHIELDHAVRSVDELRRHRDEWQAQALKAAQARLDAEKERDALRAKVGRLEDALDVTRSNFTFVSNSLEARNKDARAAEAQRDAAIEQVKALEGAKAIADRLAGALDHMQICGECAEDSWETCEGGRKALAALSAYRETKKSD